MPKRKHSTQIANARQRIKDRQDSERKKGFALGAGSDTRSDFEKIEAAGEELDHTESEMIENVEEAFGKKSKQDQGKPNALDAFMKPGQTPENDEAEAGD